MAKNLKPGEVVKIKGHGTDGEPIHNTIGEIQNQGFGCRREFFTVQLLKEGSLHHVHQRQCVRLKLKSVWVSPSGKRSSTSIVNGWDEYVRKK